METREVPAIETPAPVYRSAGREAVIAHSRAHYSVPRAEAERQVAAQYGHDVEEEGEGEEAVARRHLFALGVSREQVAELFQNYAFEDIRNQLDWLKHRGAKSPGRFIVAAIQGSYEPPARVRLERAVAEEDAVPENKPETLASDGLAGRDGFEDVSLEVPPAVGKV